MSKNNVVALKKPVFFDAVSELLRTGARRIIAEAIESELESFLVEVSEELSNGKKRVVRNGYLPERQLLTGVGAVDIRLPRVRDRKEDGGIVFNSSMIPAYMRRTATLNEMIPLLFFCARINGRR